MVTLCDGKSTSHYRPAITLSVNSVTPPTTNIRRRPLPRLSYSSSPISADYPSRWNPSPISVDCPLPWNPSHPSSPPESNSQSLPGLSDEVCSFIQNATFNSGTREITACRVITGVSEVDSNSVMSMLQNLHYKARITYLSHPKLLIITLPSRIHENVAIESQIFIRQVLYEQGFYPPSLADDINNVYYTGAADVIADKSKFQADGSLHITGQKMPFLVVEVADSESYVHALMKAKGWLKLSGGMVRFVVIIKLVRKTAKELREESLKQEDLSLDGQSEQEGQDDDETGAYEEQEQVQQAGKKAGKRAAPDQQIISVKIPRNDPPRSTPQPASTPSSPSTHSSLALPLPKRHSRATVTVLTSAIEPHPRLPGKKKRTIITTVDNIEVWPRRPTPGTALTFSWDDMNMKSYPEELKDRVFTITWDWLHELLVKMILREQTQENNSELELEVDGDDLVKSSSSVDGQGGSEDEEVSVEGENDSNYEP